MRKWLKKIIPKPKIGDETVQELGLIAFFCIFYAGLFGYDWRIGNIICGLIGCWFFYPRGGR